MQLSNSWILHHSTLMQLQQYNPNKFKQRGTLDIVALKVDESVLMGDSSIAHKMNSYFSWSFTTEDNVNLSYTLVGCLLTRNLYILFVQPVAIIDYGFWLYD